jgi:hypothetical protein
VDGSKAVLPGATVSVKNQSTQVTRDAVTDANGAYVITNLLAGTYDIKVTLASFKTSNRRTSSSAPPERLAMPRSLSKSAA